MDENEYSLERKVEGILVNCNLCKVSNHVSFLHLPWYLQGSRCMRNMLSEGRKGGRKNGKGQQLILRG